MKENGGHNVLKLYSSCSAFAISILIQSLCFFWGVEEGSLASFLPSAKEVLT